jgi:hypothetical protein
MISDAGFSSTQGDIVSNIMSCLFFSSTQVPAFFFFLYQ